MVIEARAPTRIDLAGGTLDIAPLYLLLDGGLTLNLALTRYARVRLEPGAGVTLTSEDTGDTVTAPRADALPVDGPLGLVARAVRHAGPETGLRVTTRVEVPVGSGLGASSALLVALLAALAEWPARSWQASPLIQTAANLEAQVIRIPTGWQDYYAAVHGGLSVLSYGIEGVTRTELDIPGGIAALTSRLMLCYSGAAHQSAVSNWAMLKGYIEGGPAVGHLQRIRDTAVRMRAALATGDWPLFDLLLNEEWENRKRLADGVSTPEIERCLRAARDAGATAGKVCGAGGGGCLVIACEPAARAAVTGAVRAAGAEVLEFDADLQGVVVERRGD